MKEWYCMIQHRAHFHIQLALHCQSTGSTHGLPKVIHSDSFYQSIPQNKSVWDIHQRMFSYVFGICIYVNLFLFRYYGNWQTANK